MEVLKTVENYSLNKGTLQSEGLYNIASSNGALSLWFDKNEIKRILNLSDRDFIIKAEKLIDFNDVLIKLFPKFSWKQKSNETDSYFGTREVLPNEKITDNSNLLISNTRYIYISGLMRHLKDQLFTYVIIYTGAKEFYFMRDDEDEEEYETSSDIEFNKYFFSAKNTDELIAVLKDNYDKL